MNEVKFKANIKDLGTLQAVVSAIPEIPTPETTDEGKVLTVSVDSSGETPVAEYDLAAPASGLPAIASGDAGKVLTVNAGETGAEWASPAGGGGSVIIYYDDQDESSTSELPTLPADFQWQLIQGSSYIKPYKDANKTNYYSYNELVALIESNAYCILKDINGQNYNQVVITLANNNTLTSPPVAQEYIEAFLTGYDLYSEDKYIGYSAYVKDTSGG